MCKFLIFNTQKRYKKQKNFGNFLGFIDNLRLGLPLKPLDNINVLELGTAFFALKSFGDKITGAHIQLHLVHTTAVAYINNMGGSKSLELNCLAIKMWDWSIERENWISAVHLAGKLNVRADA